MCVVTSNVFRARSVIHLHFVRANFASVVVNGVERHRRMWAGAQTTSCKRGETGGGISQVFDWKRRGCEIVLRFRVEWRVAVVYRD